MPPKLPAKTREKARAALPGLERLLRDLNAAQREAVLATEGPLLVLAGAGTGKTRVIAHRVAHLLLRGVPPESVLGVTFTNKAAREMRERIARLLGGPAPHGLVLSTFHALGARILRAEGTALGLRPDFTVQDTSDQLALLRTLLRDIKGPIGASHARAVLAAISRARNRFASPEDLVDEATGDFELLVARAFARYEEARRRLNAVDFDDLILLTLRLLEEDERVRARYQRLVRYLLVDEYQDTNGSQYRFTRALVGPERNICVVGDDDQSIYAFRGAERDKILSFERDFPGARVVTLEENYRSSGAILALANAVIAVHADRRPKRLRSTRGRGESVRWVTAPSGDAEVDFVVGEAADLVRRGGLRWSDIAVLLRAAAQARPFEEKLRLRRIPYRVIGGQSYYDRKEVRDAIAYFKAAHNPRDDFSLLRVINTPRRGFGETAVARLDELARARGASLAEALGLAAGGAGEFAPRLRGAARELAEALERARQREADGRYAAMCRGLLEEVGYRTALGELYSDPLVIEARWGAVESLLESVERFEKAPGAERFGAFLAALALDAEEGREDRDDDEDGAGGGAERRGLVLQTLHSAKGLEYPVVFLAGVEEEILPHRRAVDEGESAIEEERRLFYVGITRARERLYLTSAAARSSRGRLRSCRPSRFLTELGAATPVETVKYDPDAAVPPEEARSFLDEYQRLRAQQDGPVLPRVSDRRP